ncbi:MAG: hypothetical protein HY809_02410 [Nitrospirae bacterium]|nr:hypothetical protein [Nitrospirota bacterium]
MLLQEIKSIKSGKSELRKFGITVGGAFLILGAALMFYKKGAAPYILSLSAFLMICGAVLPLILKPLYRLWMAIAFILGWFMTRLILGILFYLVFTAIGLISKMTGKHFLDLKMNGNRESYWHPRKAKEFRQSDYERQF